MDKTKFLKTLLTTASAVAVMATGVQNAAAAPGDGFSVPTANNANTNANNFKNGAGANGAAANNGAPFRTGNNMINALAANANANAGANFKVDTANVEIGSIDVYGRDSIITVTEDSSLGAVFNSVAGNGANSAKTEATAVHNIGVANNAAVVVASNAGGNATATAALTFGANKTVTLTGKAAAVAGGTSPVAFGAAINKYSSLGKITFNAAGGNAGAGAGGTLMVNAAGNDANGNNTITLDVATVDATNIAQGHLNAATSLIVNAPSFAEIGKTTVADGKSITYNIKDSGATTGKAYALGATSELKFNVTQLTGGKDFIIDEDLRNNPNHIDGQAKISFSNDTQGQTLTIKSGVGVKTLGQDASKRLGSVSFSGAGDINVEGGASAVNIFSKVIEKEGAGKLTVGSNIDQGGAAAVDTHFNLKEGEAVLAQLKTKGVNLGQAGAADVTLTVDGNGSALGDVTTTIDNKGKLIFSDGFGGTSTVGKIGVNGGALESVKVSGGDTITIGGDAFAGKFELGDIAAKFQVADQKTLTGKVVNTSGAAGGILEFDQNGEVTGTIGGAATQALAKVIAAGNGTVKIKDNAFADEFELGNIAAKFQVADQKTLTGKVVNTSGAAGGILEFDQNGEVTGTIGGAGTQALAKVIAAGDGTVKIKDNAFAGSFELGNGGAKFQISDQKILTGNVVNTTGAVGGLLEFDQNGEVTGTIGGAATQALAKVIAAGNGIVKIKDNAFAGSFELGNDAAQFKVSDQKILTGDVVNTTGNNGKGKLILDGQAEVTGNIGAANAALELVQLGNAFGGNKILTLSKAAGDHHAHFKFADDDGSTILVTGAGAKITGNIEGVNGRGILAFTKNGEIVGKIGATGANASSPVAIVYTEGELKLSGEVHAADAFYLNGANASFVVEKGGVLKGDVVNNAINQGKLKFLADAVVEGNIGVGFPAAAPAGAGVAAAALAGAAGVPPTLAAAAAAGAAAPDDLDEVIFDGAGTVKIEGSAYAKQFTFNDENAQLIVTDGNDLDGVIRNTVAGKSAGKILFEGDAEVANIGENGKALKEVTSNAKEVSISGKSYVDRFNLGKNGSFEVADGAELHGDIFNINGATNGSLTMEGAAKINGNIGEAGKALTLVKLADGAKTLDLLKANSTHYTNFQLGNDAASKLQLADGVTIHGNILGNTLPAAAPTGQLIFTGNGTVDGLIGVDSAGTAAAEVSLVQVKGTLSLDKAGTHNVTQFTLVDAGSEVKAADGVILNAAVTTNTAGKGKLTFTGSGAVNSTVGAVGKALEFVASSGAGTVKLCADSYAGSFNLGNEKSIFDVADSVKLTGNVVNVTDADNQGTLNFLKTGTLDGNIGSAEKPLELVVAATDNVNLSKENSVHYSKNFKVGAAGSKFTLGKGASYNGNFIVSNTGVGELSFNGTGAKIVGNVGGAGSIFKLVNFAENGSISGDLYANSVEIADGKRVDFGKLVSVTSGIKLLGDKSIVGFNDGAVYDSIIDPNGSTKGVLRFAGASTINKQIKDVSNVMFGADSVDVKVIDRGTINQLKFTNLNADVTSPTISSGHSVLYATNSAKLGDSASTSTATVQYFGAAAGKTLSFVNKGDAGSKLSLSGNAAVVLDKIVLNGKVDPGKVAMSSGKLDITGMTSLSVVIDDTGAPKVAENDTESYNFLTLPAGTDLSAVNIAVNNLKDGLSLEKWTASIDGTTVSITRADNTEEAVKDVVVASSGNSADVANLVTAIRNNEGINEIVRNIKNSDKIVELGQRLKVSDPKEIVSNVTTKVATQNAIRLNALNSSQFVGPDLKTASADQKGVAAGDYGNARHGVWVSPFYGSSTQKALNSAAGYKSSTFGGSFGVDTKPNDHSIIGMSLAVLNTDVKYKDFKVGDKNKINSLMFSVYGMHQITDNWFAQAIATVGSSATKTNERRLISDSQYQTAKAKYTSVSFNGELLFGYNYLVDEFLIAPKAGMRFSRVNDTDYKESGTTNQNLSVSRKALNRAEIVVGGTASHRNFDVNGMSITPEVHAFFNHEMIGKKSNIDIKLAGGSKIDAGSSKPVRSTYNVGTGVSFMHNSMEYGLSYDAIIASKFTGHQGTLKVRVNF